MPMPHPISAAALKHCTLILDLAATLALATPADAPLPPHRQEVHDAFNALKGFLIASVETPVPQGDDIHHVQASPTMGQAARPSLYLIHGGAQ